VTTKTEAANEVRKVLQSVKDRLAQPGGTKVNEATTRAHFITPLLAALGYQSIDDVQYEVYLPDGKTFLDYRLVVDGKPRVSVEAKGLDVAIQEKDAAQAVQYASLLGDEWAVVTNAREWRVYQTFAPIPLAERLIVSANLVGWDTDVQFESLFEQLWLVSQDAFVANDGPAAWVNSRKLESLLHDALVDPASPQVKYLRKQLEAQGVVTSPQQVASWFKARLDSVTPQPNPATSPSPETFQKPTPVPQGSGQALSGTSTTVGEPGYWLIPAGKQYGMSAEQHLQMWLTKGFWGFGERTPGRKSIRVGDLVAFYASKKNEVLAHARIAGELTSLVTLEEWPDPSGAGADTGAYKVPLSDVTWLAPAVRVDAATRATLDAFSGKNPNGNWSFLVQTTRRLSKADFLRLTGR
jgi:hypothetical protein